MPYRKLIFSLAWLLLLASTVLFTANACKHESLVPDKTDTIVPLLPCDSNLVYFQNDIMPYINSSCAIPGCHDNGSPAAGINLSSYDAIMRSKVQGVPIVIPGDAQNSKLSRAVFALDLIPMPPLFNLPIPGNVKQDIKTWVNQGAENTACDAVCDTSSYKYAKDIAPMMRKYCSGCHYGDYASAGIYTTTYNRVKALVDSNNILYKTITGTPGFVRMPTGNVTMAPCDIIKVRKWIESGAPNN